MAKVTAPLLSFGGLGTIAKTAVFSKWKGRPYVRQYVIPSNPQTAGQTLTRNAFGWSNSVWKIGGTLMRAPWERFAVGQVLTGRNAFMGRQVATLRSETDLLLMQFSPGAKGGLAPVSQSLAEVPTQITSTVTVPTAPTGWTLTSAIGVAIRDQDPQSGVLYETQEVEDLTAAPYDLVFTGLTNSVLYIISVWLKWAKPDGSIAYGASITGSETPLP